MLRPAFCCTLATIGCLFSGCSDESERPEEDSAPVATSQSIEASLEDASFFTVDSYDPERNAADDLAMTVDRASKSKKRILIEVGGKW